MPIPYWIRMRADNIIRYKKIAFLPFKTAHFLNSTRVNSRLTFFQLELTPADTFKIG